MTQSTDLNSSSYGIEAFDLEKQYGLHTALHGVSFKVPKGEIVGFLGPNGAGKTTTMRILTGYYLPTQGDAKISGYSVLKQGDQVRREIGYLPETPPLYPEMSVKSYLQFVLELKGIARSQRKAQLDWAAESCGLTHKLNQVIGTLSKGYRQRVGLAQAIVHKPSVIILDEPTVGLDPLQIQEVRKLIQSFRGQHTVLLSTHILSEVTASCDRAMIIHRGRMIHEQTLSDMSEKQSLEELFLSVISKDEVQGSHKNAAA